MGFLLLIIASSCKPPRYLQHAVYFQDSVTQNEKTIMSNPVVIKPGDRLSIAITAINKEAADAFNATAASASGYLVDSSGNIQILQLGVIHVAGYTTAQLKDLTISSLKEKSFSSSLTTGFFCCTDVAIIFLQGL